MNCVGECRIKYKLGNIKQNSIAELWNNDTARWIRRKMYAGEWQDICRPTCPIIVDYLRNSKFIKYEELENEGFVTPKLIEEIRAKKDYLESPPANFLPDTSSACNLRCIMCPTKETEDDPVMQKKLWADLKQYLPTAKIITITAWGEPLVRPDTKELLINYKGSAKFGLITNGLLLPKYWNQIKHQKFAWLHVSTNAASKETYEKIRVGAKWEDLLKALDLVKQNRNKFDYILLNMTIMRSTYREIPQFINLAESYGFNCVLHKLIGEFGDENIFEPKDATALEELKNIVIKESSKKRNINIHWGDLLAHLDIPPNINLVVQSLK